MTGEAGMPQSESPSKLEWKDVEIAPGRLVRFHFGPLSIHAGRAGSEWRIAWKRSSALEAAAPWSPADSQWRRLTGTGAESTLRFAPAMQDRPLVLKLDNPLLLLRDSKTRIYAGIPVSVRAILLSGGSEITIADVPTVLLSNSWLGKPSSGQPCYWKKSRATPEPDHSYGEEYAFCPIALLNRDARDLAVDRLEIPLQKLGLWDAGGRLWTGTARVSFRSAADFDVSVSDDRPPEERPDAKRVATPRAANKGGLDLREINPLKIFSEWRL